MKGCGKRKIKGRGHDAGGMPGLRWRRALHEWEKNSMYIGKNVVWHNRHRFNIEEITNVGRGGHNPASTNATTAPGDST